VPEDLNLKATWNVFKMNVGQDPIGQKSFAPKFHAELVAYGAVCAVAPDQPRSFDCFFNGIAGGGKGAGIGALVGAAGGFVGGALTGNKQVEIPAETALTFTLSAPLTLPPRTE